MRYIFGVKGIGLLVAVSLSLSGCWFGGKSGGELKNDQDFINFALEAERSFYRVIYYNNSEVLKQYHLQPLADPIRGKGDVTAVMEEYWDEQLIEEIWKLGSELMPTHAFGFYTDDFIDLGLLEAKDIRVKRRGLKEVVVYGTVDVPGSDMNEAYRYVKEIRIKKTPAGWRAMIVREE
jgi:hypothetical protein